MRWTVPLLLGLTVAVQGCTPTCAATCQRFYEADQCDAPPASFAREDAIAQCQDVCDDALQKTGPAADAADARFNPAVPATKPFASPQIANEKEAGAWMDCVWSFETKEECHTKLSQQYCVRVF